MVGSNTMNSLLLGFLIKGFLKKRKSLSLVQVLFESKVRSVYKELHADHETGAADNK